MNWKTDDTIAAIATPVGIGGVAIVRVSGAAAPSAVDGLFRPSGKAGLAEAPSHRMLHGWIEQEGRTVDEVLAVRMKAPHSYTREEVVEVHCHGGPLAARTILDLICGRGVRLAEAGEFTFRAFLNGRLDLTQAEAVADIVRAPSRLGLHVSANQLRGRLHDEIEAIRDDLGHLAALVAASIDFPEEDAVTVQREDCLARLSRSRERLRELLETADRGRILREGLAVAIAGKPNVGKSSLLNALLREDRAIVTEISGTTRDTVEEVAELGGLALRLIDTAGIRESRDRVEREGIARSRRAMELADLTLLVVDGSQALEAEDRRLLEAADPARTLVAVNKRDLMAAPLPAWIGEVARFEALTLSALTGAGLDGLEEWVRRWALRDERPVLEAALITNLRQKHAAARALEFVEAAHRALRENVGEELLAVDLSRALDALGDIVGETTAEDLLDRIFEEFCIGK